MDSFFALLHLEEASRQITSSATEGRLQLVLKKASIDAGEPSIV